MKLTTTVAFRRSLAIGLAGGLSLGAPLVMADDQVEAPETVVSDELTDIAEPDPVEPSEPEPDPTNPAPEPEPEPTEPEEPAPDPEPEPNPDPTDPAPEPEPEPTEPGDPTPVPEPEPEPSVPTEPAPVDPGPVGNAPGENVPAQYADPGVKVVDPFQLPAASDPVPLTEPATGQEAPEPQIEAVAQERVSEPLPATGASVTGFVAAAGTALVAGGGLMLAVRRKTTSE